MPATSSVMRHLLTYLAGIGGVLLSAHLIAADQVDAVNKAGADLIAPLTIILGAVAACVARLTIAWISRFFGRVSGDAGDDAGAGMLLIWVGTAAGLFCSLPSCSPAAMAAIRAVPLQACYLGDHGEKICYSSRDGVLVEVDRQSRK